MSTTVIFANGVFKPIEPLNLPDGTRAEVTFITPPIKGDAPSKGRSGIPDHVPADDWLRRLTTISEEKAASMHEAVRDAFGKVDPQDFPELDDEAHPTT